MMARRWSRCGMPNLVCDEIGEVIYVLHAFKKKAHHGIATPKKELALIEKRLKDAKEKVRRG
jgi:phage-related protein